MEEADSVENEMKKRLAAIEVTVTGSYQSTQVNNNGDGMMEPHEPNVTSHSIPTTSAIADEKCTSLTTTELDQIRGKKQQHAQISLRNLEYFRKLYPQVKDCYQANAECEMTQRKVGDTDLTQTTDPQWVAENGVSSGMTNETEYSSRPIVSKLLTSGSLSSQLDTENTRMNSHQLLQPSRGDEAHVDLQPNKRYKEKCLHQACNVQDHALDLSLKPLLKLNDSLPEVILSHDMLTTDQTINHAGIMIEKVKSFPRGLSSNTLWVDNTQTSHVSSVKDDNDMGIESNEETGIIRAAGDGASIIRTILNDDVKHISSDGETHEVIGGKIEETTPQNPAERNAISNNIGNILYHETTLSSSDETGLQNSSPSNPTTATTSNLNQVESHVGTSNFHTASSSSGVTSHNSNERMEAHLPSISGIWFLLPGYMTQLNCNNQQNNISTVVNTYTNMVANSNEYADAHSSTTTQGIMLPMNNDKNSSEKIYDLCDKAFKVNSQLARKSMLYTRDKPFQCPVCLKKFTGTYSCKWHLALSHHSSDLDIIDNRKYKPHQRQKCSYSDKGFKQKVDLKTHQRINFDEMDEKRYKCSACGQRFKHEGQCKRHVAIHNRRRYQCPSCDQDFKCVQTLQNHLKIDHPALNVIQSQHLQI